MIHLGIMDRDQRGEGRSNNLLPRPHTSRVILSYHPQLLLARRLRLSTVLSQPQFPAGLFLHLLDGGAGMIGLEQGFSILFIEGEEGQGGNERGWAAPGEANSPAPGLARRAVFVGVA